MNLSNIKVIAFDADDTLWDNQTYFDEAEDFFIEVLKPYGSEEYISDELFKAESSNMEVLGYGAKAVCISMMETAIRISNHQIGAADLEKILKKVKSLLSIPVPPLPGVVETLSQMHQDNRFKMILLTKGDVLDQENKVKRSGLAKYFDRVVIVSKKGIAEYQQLLDEENISAENFLMIGNSFKSDIQPVLEIGGYGIHIPFHTTWRHEVVSEYAHSNCIKITGFDQILPTLGLQI